MKKQFSKIEYMTATSDVWERSNRSYIAVSVHYFDDKLKLHTHFIACERFFGRHTNDKVAEKLHDIFNRFEILGKVFFITTDGAGEYTAAMKYFGDNYRSIQNLDVDVDFEWLLASDSNELHEINEPASAHSENEDQYSDTDDESLVIRDAVHLGKMPYTVAASESTNTNDAPREDEERFIVHDLSLEPTDLLPNLNRIGCSAHLLDKLGKVDALNANSNKEYAEMYKIVFNKLEKIWDIKNSRLYAEVYSKITGRKIIGPHRIRWSKTFDAVSSDLFEECVCVF